jgi:hypothetical protein
MPACDPRELARAMMPPTSLSTRWSGVVHVKSSIALGSHGTLTIAPGTTVFVDPEQTIEIGFAGGNYGIDAQGTPAAPIRFCPARSGQAWGGIIVRGNAAATSALAHVLIEGGGSIGAALTIERGIQVDHVWVGGAARVGVAAHDFRNTSRALTVTRSGGVPLDLTGSGAVERLPLGGTFTGNHTDLARLSFDVVAERTRFRKLDIPYELAAGLTLRGGAVLTVDPATELRVGVDKHIVLGWNHQQVEVHIDGTAQEPVIIRGSETRAGTWGQILVEDNVLSTSTITHTRIVHGGGGNLVALGVRAPITVRDVTIEESEFAGFGIAERGLSPESARLTVTKSLGEAGTVHPNALTTLPAGGSFRGNGKEYVTVTGGAITQAGTIPKIDVPLRVLDAIDLRNGAALTIAPGAEFEMHDAASWVIGWNGQPASVQFVGTAEQPIVFRGVTAQVGAWPGILLEPGVSRASRLEHVHIGQARNTAALTLGVPVTVSSCRFFDASGYGISAALSDPNAYESQNTFERTALGAVTRY